MRKVSLSILLSTGFLLCGCGWNSFESTKEWPHIILICTDTLRADHLGAYGYSKDTSPWLDEWATAAILFETAYSPTSTTNPSHSSLFTSLYPTTHGIWGNKNYELPPEAVTLAEILQDAGYQTAAFTSVWHLAFELNGLGQGFEFHWGSNTWTDNRAAVSGSSLFKRLRSLYQRFFAKLDRGKKAGQIPAEETNRRVLTWLDRERDGRPLFLFVHYFDTHIPYSPPERYLSDFYRGDPRDPDHRSMESIDLHPDQLPVFETWLEGITDIQYVEALYDASIRYLDDQLRSLAEELMERGLWEDSLVIFTADHGESLTEHGIYFDHLGLYEPSVRIPLLIRAPGWTSRRIASPVNLVDLLPTILDLVGLPTSPAFEGISLLGHMGGNVQRPKNQPIFMEHAHVAALGIRLGHWKYIYPLDAYYQMSKQEELFQLSQDPGEENNLAQVETAVVCAMRQRAQTWLKRERPVSMKPLNRPAPQELLEQLKSLGYIR